MRITFMGTSVIERRAQQRSSVFVELGNGESFVFDCGSGVVSNYVAMGVPWSRMSKVFLTHLHGDHTSDLTHVFCFGPQGDRKFPLYIWGPSQSGIPNPAYVAGDPPTRSTSTTGRSSSASTSRDEPLAHGVAELRPHSLHGGRWRRLRHLRHGTRLARGQDREDLVEQCRIANPSESSDNWTAYQSNGVRISYFPCCTIAMDRSVIAWTGWTKGCR